MIYEKLMNIQKELFVPKGQKNDFGKFNYRSCEDILKVLKPLCIANGCVLYMTNDVEQIEDRFYIEAKVTLTDIESGESVSSRAQAREDTNKKGMDGSQVTGAASSYARKYALAGLFCIDNEKDADTNEYTKKQQEEEYKPDEKKLAADLKKKKKILGDLCQKSEAHTEKYKEYMKKNKLHKEDLTMDSINDLIVLLSKM